MLRLEYYIEAAEIPELGHHFGVFHRGSEYDEIISTHPTRDEAERTLKAVQSEVEEVELAARVEAQSELQKKYDALVKACEAIVDSAMPTESNGYLYYWEFGRYKSFWSEKEQDHLTIKHLRAIVDACKNIE